MAVSYNGLWKLLIDKNMKKVDMMNQVGISSSTVAKMTNGELVSLKVLEKICEKLDCDFGDIVHYEGKPQGGCIHEQVAKADCECPLYDRHALIYCAMRLTAKVNRSMPDFTRKNISSGCCKERKSTRRLA